MTYKCIIWGTGVLYDDYINNICCEIVKNNIEIVAVTSDDQYMLSIDGFLYVKKEEIPKIIYDYIIVACDFNSAKNEALALGIPFEKMLKVQIFRFPKFDFNEYVLLKESNISIVSNHCWGGFASHTLGLRFNSPFVNLYMDERDYIKLLAEFEYYMSIPLEMYKDGDSFGEPVGILKDVKIYFLHYASFKAAEEAWNRRKKRLNYENLFVEMTIRDNPDLVKEFVMLPFEKKKCFVHFDAGDNNVCARITEFSEVRIRKKYNHRFKEYMHNTVEINCMVSRPYNLIKLLNGDTDFMRKKFK